MIFFSVLVLFGLLAYIYILATPMAAGKIRKYLFLILVIFEVNFVL